MKQKLYMLYQITRSSIKLQNESSYLGFLWYLLGPLLLFSVLLFVFHHRLGSGIQFYPLYLLLGVILWNFFSAATGKAMSALFANAVIIKSLPIRIEFLLLSSLLHSLIIHMIEVIVFFVVLCVFGVSLSVVSVLLFLVVLSSGFLFSFGIGMALSVLYPLFRDLQQIWSVLLRAWWFATPIFYAPTPTGPGRILSLFNPMYYNIHLSRELLIYQRIPDPSLFLIFGTIAVCSCIGGYVLLRLLRSHCTELL